MNEKPTSERLADVLEAEGLADLAKRARAFDFDDYKSESPLPMADLVRELHAAKRIDLVGRAMAGEWDGTPAESAAWLLTPEGCAAIADLEDRTSSPLGEADLERAIPTPTAGNLAVIFVTAMHRLGRLEGELVRGDVKPDVADYTVEAVGVAAGRSVLHWLRLAVDRRTSRHNA